jgi:hypothetical protein
MQKVTPRQDVKKKEIHVQQNVAVEKEDGTYCETWVRSGYAPVNGLEMYYEIHGSTSGKSPPLVLLHGGGSTIETSFGKVLPFFAKTR